MGSGLLRCWSSLAVLVLLSSCGSPSPSKTGKVFAGGLQDQSDALQLLAEDETRETAAVIDARVKALPAAARKLWRKLRSSIP